MPQAHYSPPASTAGQGVSIAIVNPQLGDEERGRLTTAYTKLGQAPPADMLAADPAYHAFSDAIGRGLLQYFTGSGFTVSGPFKTVDDMTFPEKKQADLVLTISLNTRVNHPQPVIGQNAGQVMATAAAEQAGSGGALTGVTYTLTGPCDFSGTIDVVMWEPLSMQRMWAKSIDVPTVQADCTMKSTSGSIINTLVNNSAAHLYEQSFPAVMTAAQRYFDPSEVALVKQQSQELRTKKVY